MDPIATLQDDKVEDDRGRDSGPKTYKILFFNKVLDKMSITIYLQ